MIYFAIVICSVALIFLILYLGEFKFEFKLNKNNQENLPDNSTILDNLSNTELNILRLVSEGKSNQDIADELFISVHTVKKHVSNIFKKLDIKSRTETRKYKNQIDSLIHTK